MIMNKKGFLKALILGFVIAIVAVFVSGQVMAQVINTQIMLQNGLAVALDGAGNVIDPDDIAPEPDPIDDAAIVLLDNFEYWNNPRNMGWMVQEPPYPVWGYGLGYAQLNCVVDFEQGSKVLDVYRQMSVFLMGTPYEVLTITKGCSLLCDDSADDNDSPRSIPGSNSIMHVEIRAPLAIEQFDQFEIILAVKATSGSNSDQDVSIRFRPIDMAGGCYNGVINPLDDDDDIDEDDQAKSTIVVAMGRMFQDGTWHLVMPNLADIVDAYDEGATLDSIEAFIVRGNQYRLDNIMFIKPEASIAENGAVHLFHVGRIYCQLYGQQGLNPEGRWILAEDGDLGITAAYDEDGDMVLPQISDGTTDADGYPVVFEIEDGVANIVTADRGELRIYNLDPNDRPDLADDPRTSADADLEWILTMGDTLGPVITDGFVERADIDADLTAGDFDDDQVNTWPPYLIQEDGILIVNTPDPNFPAESDCRYVKETSNPVYAIACALANSDYDVFPNAIRIVPHLGQVFEDMIVTCRCSDGVVTDKETFPVSVVNYPVTNQPPIINDVDDQIFYVGQPNAYQIVAVDPDPQDMGLLTFNATLNGLPSYQYGPWSQNIIHPRAGVLYFSPQFEGALDCIITVEDPRGMFSVAEITIFCVNQGTWFNHPPIVLGDLDSPQTVRAGEMFIADEMDFQDPDGDRLYWSCNIGSVGDNGIYTFQTMFPGYYLVQITAYDIRGGAATTEFLLHVRPWWSL
jgi:hypothetical protein